MIAERAQEPAELPALVARQAREHLVHLPVVDRQDRSDQRATADGEPNARCAAVVRVGTALDDAIALRAIDEPGDVPRGDEQSARQAGERLTVVTMEARQEIEAGHRHALSRSRRLLEAPPELAEHESVARQEAEPDADRLLPRGRLRHGIHGYAGRTATPSISTRAPGSSKPATFTRLIAG